MFHWSIQSNLTRMPFSSFYLAGSYLLQSKFILPSIITKLCNQWQPKNICTVPKRTIKHGSNMCFHSSATNISTYYHVTYEGDRPSMISTYPKLQIFPKLLEKLKAWNKSMTRNLNKCCNMLRRCFNWYSKVTLLM
jgi:hypothetical protein